VEYTRAVVVPFVTRGCVVENVEGRLTRREFVKAAGAGAGAIAVGGWLTEVSHGAVEVTMVSDQLGWLKISQFSGFFAAQEKGYYKREGLDVSVKAGGPNIIASQVVASGKALVGDDDNTTVLQAIDKRLPLVVYGAIFQKSPYAVMSFRDKPIRTLKDFAGKTVALSPATKPQLLPLLEKAGVSESSVKFVPAGPDPGQLASHQVDGYFGYATAQGVTLKEQGLDIVLTYFDDLGFPSYANVLITRKDTLAKNKVTLVHFLRGTIMGYQYSLKYPDEMGKLVATKYGPSGLSGKTEASVHRAQAPLIRSPRGVLWVDQKKMGAVIKAAAAAGSISKVLPLNQVMTTEILRLAYRGKNFIPLPA
jgi:NitT/TauT family transport system substrate-binding protein